MTNGWAWKTGREPVTGKQGVLAAVALTHLKLRRLRQQFIAPPLSAG